MPREIDQLIAQAARKAGVPQALFASLILNGERSWKGWQTSPAGAFGPSQLMPGTAKGLEQKYGIDTSTRYGNVLGGAYYLAEQLRAFGGNQRKAVAAYNAGPGNVQKYGGVPPFSETQNYVKNVMSGVSPTSVRASPGGAAAPAVGPAPGPPPFDPRSPASTQRYLTKVLGSYGQISKVGVPLTTPQSGWGQGIAGTIGTNPKLLNKWMSKYMPPIPPAPAYTDLRGHPTTQTVQAGDPSGGWAGSQALAADLAMIGVGFGLKVTSEKRDTKATASGGVSDHWVGSKNAYAYDIGGTVSDMDRAAASIMAALGVRYDGRSELVATTTIGGYRYQVLYRTNVGGNHFNHIHIGVKRV